MIAFLLFLLVPTLMQLGELLFLNRQQVRQICHLLFEVADDLFLILILGLFLDHVSLGDGSSVRIFSCDINIVVF